MTLALLARTTLLSMTMVWAGCLGEASVGEAPVEVAPATVGEALAVESELNVTEYDLVLEHGVRVARSTSYSATVANIEVERPDLRKATMTLEWTPNSQLAEELGVELWFDVPPETLLEAFGKSPLIVDVPADLMATPGRYFANPIPGETTTLAKDQTVKLTLVLAFGPPPPSAG